MNFFDIALVLAALPTAYLYLLALSALRGSPARPCGKPRHRLAIVVPAHDEESVIRDAVLSMRQVDYPGDLFDIHVVADHCSDRTTELAREAGAIVHERNTGLRGSKAAAIRWVLPRILADTAISANGSSYDAVVLFDADTHVDSNFLRVMDSRLAQGDLVIQGQHRIRNPQDGWFAALTWAMFLIDNRFQNLGRSNLGLSAKNMGDSICFHTEVLRKVTLAEGLTEDYAFRQKLLLAGIKIQYEPAAIGLGEAAPSLRVARSQRLRWLRGTVESSRRNIWTMLRAGVRRFDPALMDGVMQVVLPAYSTLTLGVAATLLANVALVWQGASEFRVEWAALTVFLMGYPLLGLALERAPAKAYAATMAGPIFVVWRTWLALVARIGRRRVVWVRTEHGGSPR